MTRRDSRLTKIHGRTGQPESHVDSAAPHRERHHDEQANCPLFRRMALPDCGLALEAEKGNAKYTKKYIHENKGGFPVYSSQTSNFGEIGSINTSDYEEECFTWTTDGTYVGTVFYRNGKFSITTHCGILRVKPKYKNKVNFEYLNFIFWMWYITDYSHAANLLKNNEN